MKTLNQNQKNRDCFYRRKKLTGVEALLKLALCLLLLMLPSCQNNDWQSEIDALKNELEDQKILISKLSMEDKTIIDIFTDEDGTCTIQFSDGESVTIGGHKGGVTAFPVIRIDETTGMWTINGEMTAFDSRLTTPRIGENGCWWIGSEDTQIAAGEETFAGIVESTNGKILFYFADGTIFAVNKEGSGEGGGEAPLETIRVACIGNSITAGVGTDIPATNSYPVVLGELLGGDYEVKNFGVSGSTLLKNGTDDNGRTPKGYMTMPQYQQALDYNPNIVIIKLGTNDSKAYNWGTLKDQFEGDMQAMLTAFKGLVSNPTIYICYPARVNTANPSEAFQISENVIHSEIIPKIKKVADANNLKIINLHNAFDGKEGLDQFYKDKVHPNNKGAAILADIVSEAILNNKFPSLNTEHFDKVKTVGCLGDDTTEGINLPSGASITSAYPNLLKSELGEQYQVTKYGAGWRTVLKSGTEDQAKTKPCSFLDNPQMTKILAAKPDIVTIYLGLNDSRPWNWSDSENFEKDYKEMIDKLKEANPRMEIYLCCPVKFKNAANGASLDLYVNEVIPKIKKVAQDNQVELIDLSGLFDGFDEYYAANKYHPNANGHQLIAEKMAEAIKNNQ